jgi:thiamine-phosphate pyrophosphorylase
VGLSSHDAAQAREAAEEHPAYVAFGPLFGTTSKDSPFSARGLDALAEVVRAVAPRPVVAIGGIGEDQLEDIAAAGAAGAAVISAVAGASDPEDATRRLVRAFDAARSREDP